MLSEGGIYPVKPAKISLLSGIKSIVPLAITVHTDQTKTLIVTVLRPFGVFTTGVSQLPLTLGLIYFKLKPPLYTNKIFSKSS